MLRGCLNSVQHGECVSVIANLKRKFPEYSDEMVKIALESASYKADRAESILSTMQKARQRR